jgi:hypothetical protein
VSIQNQILDIDANIIGIGDSPPEEYCWSGYTKNKDEFIQNNFSHVLIDGDNLICCSLDNSIALCEFIHLYISKSDKWDQLHDCLSPGMALWFLIGYEAMNSEYDDLPHWCANIIDCYCNNSLMTRRTLKFDDMEVDMELDVFLFKENDIIDTCITEIDEILAKEIHECEDTSAEL